MFNTFVAFRSEQIGIDTIYDFGEGADLLKLDKSTFTSLQSNAGAGFSNSQEFAVVNDDSLVATAEAYILYSSSTGSLFYNANGSDAGLGSGGQFATLRDLPDVSADSFLISD
ncbi:MAG: hypothetical protein AAGE84_03280 [Cyanobacteria bacterium P01_G01_bin.39]